MANEKIMIVDDDLDMLEVLSLYLEKEGFIVTKTRDGRQTIEIIKSKQPDLIILDVLMPHIDGFELCQMIRKETEIPILFFSSKDGDTDQVLGLGLGGDAYLPKTTSLSVVTAKVKALLRRAHKRRENTYEVHQLAVEEHAELRFPGLTIKLDSAVVKVNGKEIKLSAKEYQVLTFMAQNPGRIYSVEQLFEQIWGEESLGDYRTVMVHISNLRKKIEGKPEQPKYIQTFRGIGYKFNSFPQEQI